MKTNKYYALMLAVAFVAVGTFSSCKKDTDDPAISLKSRKDRITNTWTLVKYEKNDVTQDLEGTTYMYTIKDNHTLTQTIEGSIFGFPTRVVEDGTWSFLNDEKDVRIDIDGDHTTYKLQRLANKELWLKLVDGSDTYTYYFDGL